MKNLSTRYVEALQKRGCSVVETSSRSFVKMAWPERPQQYFWIGKAGSLRLGHTLRGSVPCNQRFKDGLLAEVPA